MGFQVVPTWRPPNEVTDPGTADTSEAKRRRMTEMLSCNMHRGQESSASSGWELQERRAYVLLATYGMIDMDAVQPGLCNL